MNVVSLRAAVTGAVILFASGSAAQAADIEAIVANPMKPVVQALGSQFERESGHTLRVKFVSGPIVKRAIDAGETPDLAVSAAPVIDGLMKEGKIVSGTRADIAYAAVGVGVRAGAPKPDMDSVEAFKRALLGAKSVAHSADGPSGVHFRGLLDRLGIAVEMTPKLRPMSGDALAKAVPSGQADMIISSMPDILGEGIALVGPLPAELQSYIGFAAGVGTHAKQAQAAWALIEFLTAPAAVRVIRANGMEPGTPR